MKHAIALSDITSIRMPGGEYIPFMKYKGGIGEPDSFTNMPKDYRQMVWAIFRHNVVSGYGSSLGSTRCYWKMAKLHAWATWRIWKDKSKNA